MKCGCENKWNNNVEIDDNDEDHRGSDAEVDNKETIDRLIRLYLRTTFAVNSFFFRIFQNCSVFFE